MKKIQFTIPEMTVSKHIFQLCMQENRWCLAFDVFDGDKLKGEVEIKIPVSMVKVETEN